jgi:hypothetical protein
VRTALPKTLGIAGCHRSLLLKHRDEVPVTPAASKVVRSTDAIKREGEILDDGVVDTLGSVATTFTLPFPSAPRTARESLAQHIAVPLFENLKRSSAPCASSSTRYGRRPKPRLGALRRQREEKAHIEVLEAEIDRHHRALRDRRRHGGQLS